MKSVPDIVKQLREEEQFSATSSTQVSLSGSSSNKKSVPVESNQNGTDVQKLKQEIREKKELLERAEKIGKLGIWQWKITENTLVWSDELYRIWKWGKDTPLTQEQIVARIHPDDRENNNNMVQSLIEYKDYGSFDFRIVLPDQSIKYIYQTIEVKRDDQGKAIELFGIMQDITSQREAQIQQEQSQQRFRFLSENMADIVWTMDLKGKTTYVSPSIIHILGFSPEERLKQSLEDMLTPPSLKLAKNILKKELIREKVNPRGNTSAMTLEIEYYTKDGSTVWLENKVKWIRSESGKIIGIHGVSRDISERKKAEEQLRKSEEKYRLLTEQGMDVIFTVDLTTGQYEYMSPSSEEVFGVKPEEFYKDGDIIYQIITKDAKPFIKKIRNQILKGTVEPVFDFPIIHQKTKKKRWLRHHSTLVRDTKGKPIKLRATVYDVTEGKKTEQQLRDSEKKYRDIFNATTNSLLIFNTTGEIVHANEQACNMYGYTYDELIQLSGKDIVHPDFYPVFQEYLQNMTAGKYFHAESKDIKKDGTVIDIDVRGSTIEYNGIIHFLAVINDITEQKNDRKDLEESKQKLKFLIENLPIGVFIDDEKGRILDGNRYAMDLVGYSREEILGKTAFELKLLPKTQIPKAMKALYDTWRGKQQTQAQYTIRRKDGTLRDVEITDFLTDFNGRKTCLNIIRDITEQKKAEEALKSSEERYRKLVESSPESILTYNLSGHITSCNSKTEEITGFPKEEFLGKHFTELPVFERKQIHQFIVLFPKVLKGKLKDPIQFSFITKEGEHRLAEGMPSFIRHSGKISEIQIVIRDITEEKKAKEKQNEHIKHLRFLAQTSDELSRLSESEDIYEFIGQCLYELTDGAPISLFSYNPDTCIYTLVKATGYGDSLKKLLKVLGRNLEGFQMNVDNEEIVKLFSQSRLVRLPDSFLQYSSKYISTSTLNTIMNIVNIDCFYVMGFINEGQLFGQAIIALKKGQELKNIDTIETFIHQAAITLQKNIASAKLEQKALQVQELNIQLENKVKQRTHQIERLLKQKDEFINQLGHDLKNPLTPLTTLLPLLRKRVDDKNTQEMFDVAIQNVKYMNDLVRKTIELAKLNSPTTMFCMENANLHSIANEVITNQRFEFQRHNITIENKLENNLCSYVDPLRIEEVFNNLLSNALKYSPNGSTITVANQIDGNEIVIGVQDTGVGLTSEQLEHIFDEYYKVDHSRHNLDSSGLGLPICKRIIEKHGGRIWVESPGENKGTTFYFTLKKDKGGFSHDN